jgi:hypothetical protein
MSCPQLKAESFEKLPVTMAVTSQAITEDGKYVVLAHQSSNKISVWSVLGRKIVSTIDCQQPGPMLCRGDKIYVVKVNGGTIAVFQQENWEFVDELLVGQKETKSLSAPQGEYFTGHILASIEYEHARMRYVLIDVKQDRARVVKEVHNASYATVGYSGKVVITQANIGTSSSADVTAYGPFSAIVAEQDLREFGRNGTSSPLIHQVHDTEFWFGGNSIYRGIPPRQFGKKHGVFLIPDRNKQQVYVMHHETITCLGLDGDLTQIGKVRTSSEIEYRKTFLRRHRSEKLLSIIRRTLT